MEGLLDCDAMLIVAGAGLSVKDNSSSENVYVNAAHFSMHYSEFAKKYPQYTTGYECMGLLRDPSVPIEDKWEFWRRHMRNMRWRFEPNEAYGKLLEMASQKKDYFVLTSNVDGCFVRSGFDAERLYTPQGDWSRYQCIRGCTPESVWPSQPMLDKAPLFQVPKCPQCGSDCFGNVRGGSWFLHSPYKEQQHRLRAFIERNRQSLVVIEVGAGFNTPTVTRFISESVCRELKAPLIRINPEHPGIPEDLFGCGIQAGWQALFKLSDGVSRKSIVDSSIPHVNNPRFNYRLFLDNLL